ncbi:hypothetical protein SAMN02745823_00868 [Sporobacter termitidis DSM 10068]|uniref:Uncharacterized protein n=1 Tax=Sporobacter termitidis DSM 10068 TaxID=1123282 RepID=A0A1M5VJT1_9FIRM|nr:hypothetical protein [Sporobacter termitidis]SHH75491.1 hypothetical protein SAMN02745823_00868 [Sporobacter termitidis DSM 10068]
MIETLRAELAELSAKIERRKKLDVMLQSLNREEQELAQHAQQLNAALSKEDADVSRLEKTTATSILYAMLGKKEARLDKERQEAFSARLKYGAANRQLDDCRARIGQLSAERNAFSDCFKQYDLVFEALKETLREDPDYAERLSSLERRRGEAAGQLKELDEAISAGRAVLNQIGCIEENLDSAESWGTWDLFGGGLFADMEKHSHLDDAQADAEHLQVLLSRFHTELADVRVSASLESINIDGFLRFADYFFDGLFADWSVLSRIRDSQESVQQLRQQVSGALSRLSAMKDARVSEKSALEKELAALVTKA